MAGLVSTNASLLQRIILHLLRDVWVSQILNSNFQANTLRTIRSDSKRSYSCNMQIGYINVSYSDMEYICVIVKHLRMVMNASKEAFLKSKYSKT